MDMPIIFLSPPMFEGLTGIQRVDDETHAVVAVLLDDGTEVGNEGVSYKGIE
jgi:hypothetical protein